MKEKISDYLQELLAQANGSSDPKTLIKWLRVLCSMYQKEAKNPDKEQIKKVISVITDLTENLLYLVKCGEEDYGYLAPQLYEILSKVLSVIADHEMSGETEREIILSPEIKNSLDKYKNLFS